MPVKLRDVTCIGPAIRAKPILVKRFSQNIIGTLSNDEDDVSENVAKKMNLRSFKLNGVYLDPLNMSNVGVFSWK